MFGSQPGAVVFNRLKNDLNQMYPAADRESPMWPEHEFATHMGADSLGLTGPTYTGRKFRITQAYPVKEHATSYRVFVDELIEG